MLQLKACSDFAIELESIFQPEKILSMKQKYQMKNNRTGNGGISAGGNVPILE
jgi:hypothetical protein